MQLSPKPRSGHHPDMDLLGLMPAFVAAVVLISASPGPAMALIVRRAAVRGFAGAVLIQALVLDHELVCVELDGGQTMRLGVLFGKLE